MTPAASTEPPSSRSDAVAKRFSEAADAFISGVASLDEAAWSRPVPGGEWTPGVLVAHVAWAWEAEMAEFRRIAEGLPKAEWTQAWLDEQNAIQAERHAGIGRNNALERARTAAANVAALIRSSSDEELDRRGRHMPGEPEHSVEEWIDICLVGHARAHLREVLILETGPAT
jgi:hypothetical protein